MHLGDCGSDAGIEETVIGRFLAESPNGSQPLIDGGWGQFLFVTVQTAMVVDFAEGGGWALAGAGDGSEPQSVNS